MLNDFACRAVGLAAMISAALFLAAVVLKDNKIEAMTNMKSFQELSESQIDSAKRHVSSGQLTSASLRPDQEKLIIALEDNIRKYIVSKVVDRSADTKNESLNPLFASSVSEWGDTQHALISQLNSLEEFRGTLSSCVQTLDSLKTV